MTPGRSLMKIRKAVGPSIAPEGNPALVGKEYGSEPVQCDLHFTIYQIFALVPNLVELFRHILSHSHGFAIQI